MNDMPDLSSVQHLSLPELHDLLETSCQLLLPKTACCSLRFLYQLLQGEKAAIPLLHAKHFSLNSTSETKAKRLMEMCDGDLKLYLPDDGVPDREFLVQLIATMDVDKLAEAQANCLAKKYRFGAGRKNTRKRRKNRVTSVAE